MSLLIIILLRTKTEQAFEFTDLRAIQFRLRLFMRSSTLSATRSDPSYICLKRWSEKVENNCSKGSIHASIMKVNWYLRELHRM